jgi:hypothetical protein
VSYYKFVSNKKRLPLINEYFLISPDDYDNLLTELPSWPRKPLYIKVF